MSEQADRDALAALIAAHDSERMECHDHLDRCCPSGGCEHGFKHSAEHQADAILASDWLAQRDRRVAAEALREAAEDLAPRPSSERPCDNPEDCCGSAAHCDAVRPMRRVVGEGWLRERADRIEAGE